jgi:r-opsin
MITMAKKLKADDIRANHEKSRAEIRIAKIAMGIVFLYILSWSPYATVALIGPQTTRMFISIGTCYSTYMTFCCIFSLSLI